MDHTSKSNNTNKPKKQRDFKTRQHFNIFILIKHNSINNESRLINPAFVPRNLLSQKIRKRKSKNHADRSNKALEKVTFSKTKIRTIFTSEKSPRSTVITQRLTR